LRGEEEDRARWQHDQHSQIAIARKLLPQFRPVITLLAWQFS
jgi:hypothetical protein